MTKLFAVALATALTFGAAHAGSFEDNGSNWDKYERFESRNVRIHLAIDGTSVSNVHSGTTGTFKIKASFSLNDGYGSKERPAWGIYEFTDVKVTIGGRIVTINLGPQPAEEEPVDPIPVLNVTRTIRYDTTEFESAFETAGTPGADIDISLEAICHFEVGGSGKGGLGGGEEEGGGPATSEDPTEFKIETKGRVYNAALISATKGVVDFYNNKTLATPPFTVNSPPWVSRVACEDAKAKLKSVKHLIQNDTVQNGGIYHTKAGMVDTPGDPSSLEWTTHLFTFTHGKSNHITDSKWNWVSRNFAIRDRVAARGLVPSPNIGVFYSCGSGLQINGWLAALQLTAQGNAVCGFEEYVWATLKPNDASEQITVGGQDVSTELDQPLSGHSEMLLTELLAGTTFKNAVNRADEAFPARAYPVEVQPNVFRFELNLMETAGDALATLHTVYMSKGDSDALAGGIGQHFGWCWVSGPENIAGGGTAQ
jgi:hypothetical protein